MLERAQFRSAEMTFTYERRSTSDLIERAGYKKKLARGSPSKGRRFEYRVRGHFQCAGFFVLRSAGSRTPIDLIAFKRGMILFIQCKTVGIMTKAKRQELYTLAEANGALALIANELGIYQIVASGDVRDYLPR